MDRDVVYYFSKSDFSKHELGEIQKGFNLSFVIDGTKDSGKMEVINFEEAEVEPYTIILHNATQTWWVITNDKVEKYINDNGFLYKHNLKLLGANELLNARDLTDCGFNANRYTIGDFLERLTELSSFDFRNNFEINYGSLNSNLSPIKNVDYKKTFENYSLLSALREFLDGYNCAFKLSFETITNNNVEYINKAIFTIVSKTGNTDYQIRNMDYFNTVKETKTMDKNSFGTSVVSNAENVSSTKTKTFPSIGYTRLSAEALEITNTSAVFRLPTPIFKLNYLQLLLPYVKITIQHVSSAYDPVEITVDTTKTTTKQDLLNQLNTTLNNMTGYVPVAEKWWADVQAQIDNIIAILEKCQRVTFYTGWNLNPVTQAISFKNNSENKYIVSATKYRTGQSAVYQGPWVVGTKEDRNSMQYTPCCIYYERGSNIIRGFDLLAEDNTWNTVLGNYTHTDARTYYDNGTIFESTYDEMEEPETLRITINPANTIKLNVRTTQWKVSYIPMSDIKIKYDNNSESNDMQLYNQNGKITDGVALSKLIVSYSKEIESDTITKYRVDYSFSDCPKVGTIVNDSLGNKYVINNVSLDFYQNENGSYYIEGEYTMSKNIATKSLLTNPNSNIRDYGIPQDLNVKRKQVYRDFFELGATTDTNADTNYYQPLSRVLNLSNFYSEYKDHIGIIKVAYNNGEEWYYQLESTVYPLKKAIYEVIYFNDNNIIGYGSQNAYSGFDISRVFSGMIDTICTPISYVDDNGEIKEINVAFCSIDQVQEIYTNYVNEQNAKLGTSYNGVLYNYSVFIPEQIYNGSEEHYVSREYNYLFTIIGTSQGGLKKINLDSYMAQNNLIGNADRYVATISYGVGGGNLDLQVYEDGGDYYIDVFTPIGQTTIVSLVKITEYGYNGANVVNDFLIQEPNYKKDALEVPVFEYACQIDDSEDVDVGENILDNSSGDFLYIYTMYIKPKNYVNVNNSSYFESVADFRVNPNTNSGKLDFENLSMNSFNYLSWAVKFEYIDNETLEISMYESVSIDNNKNVTYGEQVRLDNLASEDYSFVFGRYTLNQNTQTQMRVIVDTTKCPTLADFLATNGISGNIYYYPVYNGDTVSYYNVYYWNDVSGWEYSTVVDSATGSITITSTKSDVLFSLKNSGDYTFTSDGKLRVKINHYKI